MIDFGGVPLNVEERRAYMQLLRKMKIPRHMANREIVTAGMAVVDERYTPSEPPAADEDEQPAAESAEGEPVGDGDSSESKGRKKPRRRGKH